jgi:type VI secretion system secreted protein Hcp
MATVDYFLKVDGIEGESQDTGHENEIELQSFSWGETNAGSYGGGTQGGGTGRVAMQDLNTVMVINKASPSLMLACAKGSTVDSVVLTCRKSAGDSPIDFLKYTLGNVRVTGYHSGGGSDVVPMDTVSFNFKTIEIEYTPQDDTGSAGSAVTVNFDIGKGASS